MRLNTKDNQILYRQIGERIKLSRKAAGLTQKKLSEMMGVSTQYVSDLERGIVGISIPSLIRMCELLQVSADYILSGREIGQPESISASDPLHTLTLKDKEQIYCGVKIILDAIADKEETRRNPD